MQDHNYGCNGCDGTGRKLKYPGEFADVGNVCLRSDLTEELLRESRRQGAEASWKSWLAEKRHDEFTRDMYGFAPDETLASLIARREECYLTAYAFLKDRRWCESARLGFFGMRTATECTLKAAEEGIDYEGRCIHTCEEMAAKIVTWEEESDRWQRLFWPRFIRNLPGETTLVCVDYHV